MSYASFEPSGDTSADVDQVGLTVAAPLAGDWHDDDGEIISETIRGSETPAHADLLNAIERLTNAIGKPIEPINNRLLTGYQTLTGTSFVNGPLRLTLAPDRRRIHTAIALHSFTNAGTASASDFVIIADEQNKLADPVSRASFNGGNGSLPGSGLGRLLFAGSPVTLDDFTGVLWVYPFNINAGGSTWLTWSAVTE